MGFFLECKIAGRSVERRRRDGISPEDVTPEKIVPEMRSVMRGRMNIGDTLAEPPA